MSFRLVPNSVTLNDLERRNSLHGCVISPNSVAFWADYLKVVQDTPILLQQKRRPKNVERYISYGDISMRGSPLTRALK